ncbi:unnamed protein product [Amoebophrya sp. A120]|nr:unnamed protein product [Amoebophrya sp. A120]|eukprot:GSA120T00014100001.1
MPELVPEQEQLPRRMQEQAAGSGTVEPIAVDERILRPHELGGAAAGTSLGSNVSTRRTTSSRQNSSSTAAAFGAFSKQIKDIVPVPGVAESLEVFAFLGEYSVVCIQDAITAEREQRPVVGKRARPVSPSVLEGSQGRVTDLHGNPNEPVADEHDIVIAAVQPSDKTGDGASDLADMKQGEKIGLKQKPVARTSVRPAVVSSSPSTPPAAGLPVVEDASARLEVPVVATSKPFAAPEAVVSVSPPVDVQEEADAEEVSVDVAAQQMTPGTTTPVTVFEDPETASTAAIDLKDPPTASPPQEKSSPMKIPQSAPVLSKNHAKQEPASVSAQAQEPRLSSQRGETDKDNNNIDPSMPFLPDNATEEEKEAYNRQLQAKLNKKLQLSKLKPTRGSVADRYVSSVAAKNKEQVEKTPHRRTDDGEFLKVELERTPR